MVGGLIAYKEPKIRITVDSLIETMQIKRVEQNIWSMGVTESNARSLWPHFV